MHRSNREEFDGLLQDSLAKSKATSTANWAGIDRQAKPSAAALCLNAARLAGQSGDTPRQCRAYLWAAWYLKRAAATAPYWRPAAIRALQRALSCTTPQGSIRTRNPEEQALRYLILMELAQLQSQYGNESAAAEHLEEAAAIKAFEDREIFIGLSALLQWCAHWMSGDKTTTWDLTAVNLAVNTPPRTLDRELAVDAVHVFLRTRGFLEGMINAPAALRTTRRSKRSGAMIETLCLLIFGGAGGSLAWKWLQKKE